MAITRQKKGEILTGLTETLSKAPSAVFVNFHGLTVADTTELRRGLFNDNVGYTVAKKTLLKRALASAKATGAIPALDGEVAVAYPADAESKDTTAPARGVYAFQKKFDGRLSILGGIFEGAFLDQGAMLEIATIPSQDVLRGMFVNVINSPIQGLVLALNAIAEKKQ